MTGPTPPETRHRRRPARSPTHAEPATATASTGSVQPTPPQPAPATPDSSSESGAGQSMFRRAVSAGHRRAVHDAALALLIPALAPSLQGSVDPAARFGRALTEFLDWLESHPGRSYQDRWHATGLDGVGGYHRETEAFATQLARDRFRAAVDALICLGVLRPSYDWLLRGYHRRLHQLWTAHHDHALFARLAHAADELDASTVVRRGVVIDLARVGIRTGRSLPELSCQDLLDYRAAALRIRGNGNSVSPHSTYYVARRVGLFDDGPAEFAALLTTGQRTATQLVERYGVADPAMRSLLTEYLDERRPSLDYTSFTNLADQLCRLFWCDLERAQPGIDSHRLSREQTEAWKQRVAVLPDGRPRRNVVDVFMAVRSFYLDVNHWAHDHPEQWARWAAPSPVTRHEVRGATRNRRAEAARLHARVRDVAPRLPDLVRAVRLRREHTTALLGGARRATPGAAFEVGDATYTRSVAPGATTAVLVADDTGHVFDVVFAEHEAFWAWAVVEVLRHTGIRVEELLELTHHSIRPYRQPDGEVIPLLQIAPSKTDAERVIPASPELAAALAQIVTRVATEDGTIPLTSRRDEHERCWSDPQPHLFLNRLAGRPRAFTSGSVREYLTRALGRAGFPIEARNRLTPHDFRRLFTTEAVNGGLPIHIAAALLGHQDLNTTMGYTAIYPAEVFGRYQQFIERRRAERPTEEYRAPTAAELAEFAEHFGKRRIELGTCVRPYGTPCIHEHACLRCPFQQVAAAHLPQLGEIEKDLRARIENARANSWLGDVEQLQQTLERVGHKRDLVQATVALQA